MAIGQDEFVSNESGLSVDIVGCWDLIVEYLVGQYNPLQLHVYKGTE